MKSKQSNKSIDEFRPDVARMEAKREPQKAKKPPRWLIELLDEFPPIDRNKIQFGDISTINDELTREDSVKIENDNIHALFMIEDPVHRIQLAWSWCVWKLKEHGGRLMGRRYVADERLLWRYVLNTTFHASAGKPGPVNAYQLAAAWETACEIICAGDLSFLQSIEKRQEAIKTYEKGVIQIEEIRRLAATDPKGFVPRRKAADLLGVSVPTIKLYEIPKKSKLGLTPNLEAITGPNGRVKYRHDNLNEFAESRLPKK